MITVFFADIVTNVIFFLTVVVQGLAKLSAVDHMIFENYEAPYSRVHCIFRTFNIYDAEYRRFFFFFLIMTHKFRFFGVGCDCGLLKRGKQKQKKKKIEKLNPSKSYNLLFSKSQLINSVFFLINFQQ